MLQIFNSGVEGKGAVLDLRSSNAWSPGLHDWLLIEACHRGEHARCTSGQYVAAFVQSADVGVDQVTGYLL